MSEIIKTEVLCEKELIKQLGQKNVTDDRAFSFVILKYVFDVEDFSDRNDLVTDGSNDGGIDFLYYDEEEAKIILGQSKYVQSLSYEDIINELDKMYSTVQNFKNAHTGSYNDRLKKSLQNMLDRLPDDSVDNIEYNIFTTAPVDINGAMKKINNTHHLFPADSVTIYLKDDIEKKIQSKKASLQTVKFEKIKIDSPNNYLEYESNDSLGIMCNVLSSSIISLYNKYAGEGLFDLNIRKYIRNTLVDTGIKNTLDSNRENFWFLNNGIIIACKEFEVSGDVVKLEDFSIVNGGQTTTLISTYKGNNTKEFYIPCKIVSSKDEKNANVFFTDIAEASNSQKPIYARDLKSNAPEMLILARMLENEDIYLEIKRGVKPTKNFKYSMKNDELGQILLSFVHQRPGTARSGKKTIFENNDVYTMLFKVNYMNDLEKKEFLIDLFDLVNRYSHIEKEFKQNGSLNSYGIEILKNGKQSIIALLGVIYRLVNKDINETDLKNDPKSLGIVPFTYGKFISNYKNDDIDEKLRSLIRTLINIVADAYKQAFENGQTTSVSNFLKTDPKYYQNIVTKVSQALDMTTIGSEIRNCMIILKR